MADLSNKPISWTGMHPLGAMYRAALARAEAAEAEAADLHRQLAEMATAMEEIEDERLSLAARVAELEARLASDAADENQWLDAYIESAAKDGATIKILMARVADLEARLAAQGWRPVTEDWPAPGRSVPVRLRDGRIRWGDRHEDRWVLTGGQYSLDAVTHAYVLPYLMIDADEARGAEGTALRERGVASERRASDDG